MAKADDTSSTINGPWLCDALKEAADRFGSKVLAQERLRVWMTSEQLRWSCMSFEGPTADDIARLRQEERQSIVGYILPSAAYHNGDPAFWCANLTIWWNKNAAREKSGFGSKALGIWVSREDLNARLSEVPDRREKPAPAAGRKKRVEPQTRRVLQALKKLYPPAGKVPADVSTKAVRARVSQELAADSKNQGLAAPSWDTVNRALGRD